MSTPVLKRINDGLANVEAAIAMGMLLLMLVVAFTQVILRNLTGYGVEWANHALEWLDWGDFVMQKGTLWLAFLGASLAMNADKHVAIDIVPRFASPRGRMVLRGIVGVLSCIIAYYLARAFLAAIEVNGAERPADVEVFTDQGSVHICEATDAQLAGANASRGIFCVVRSLFSAIGLEMNTPGAAFQLIVPAMLFVMSARALANGINDFIRFARGETLDDASAHGLVGNAADVAHDIDEKGHH